MRKDSFIKKLVLKQLDICGRRIGEGGRKGRMRREEDEEEENLDLYPTPYAKLTQNVS